MNQKENDLVILLTATITPNSLVNLTLKDPVLRRKQYLEAVDFYINNTNFKIVLTENSGDSLENFPLLPGRIEYLRFKSEPIHPDRGIGYKELEIIDFAFKHSVFLKETQKIVKITGRLKILNITKLADKFSWHTESKSHLVYAHLYRPKNLDSKCFFFTKDFWPYLKETGRNMDTRYNFESSLWDAAYKYQTIEEKTYVPLNVPLRVKGMSGSFGANYKHHLIFHFARLVRNYTRTFSGKKPLEKLTKKGQ